ncbi:unnamed protein product [Cuscuta epithymum]|uniref:B3 domain-containing protein n=1 Tax=Cuscuta epithymum TaxID=186058 RepID=A0AAV0E8Z0_9ASTE|nr:unnamed protein product [Cuscuta epithymum]
MVGKMILSPLPGGGYVQLREGYSSLDVLAAVCGAVLEQMEKNTNSNNSSSSSSSFPKSVFIPRRKRSRPNRSTSHEVIMAADSVLKCGVSGFKRVSIGGGPAGNQKKRAAKKMKKRVIADENQQPAAAEAGPMPERFRGRIRQLAGPGAEIAEEMLLIEKEITGTDLNPKESRLSLPLKQLRRTDFLTAEEKERLLTRHNNGINVGSVDVALIAAVNGEIIIKRELHLRRWEMRKDRGKTSVSLMVTKEWNKIKGSLGLAVGTKVQIWSVRVDGELWLSLVVL